MGFIKLCVARPVLVAMLMCGLAAIGVFSYTQLPQQIFPEVEFPVVTVATVYEGAGPEEVEQLIVKELEDEVSTAEGIKHLRGISQQGLGLLMAEFYLETDVDVAAADVRDKVNLVREMLPEAAEDPIVQKFDFNAQPIMQLAVAAPRSLREVYQMADERIKDRLATVPGVAAVNIIGGEEREIHVLVDQQRLRAHRLSITDVAAAIAAANLETPGGQIRQNSREYNIRLRGKFANLDEIRDMRVTLGGGNSVYLRDIAEVRDAYKEIRDKVRADGRTCVGITVQKRSDGNTVEVDREVRKQIARLQEVLPADYRISVQNEEASWITSSIDNVFSNMRMGIILTAVALFVFLHTFRSVIIISLTMPISVVATFIIMYGTGFTVNMMSLMGLAMTIGILVNNAILVLENICRYLHLDHEPQQAAVEGASEIAVAVASTTLTNVVVFVPIAFMGGIVGQFFKDFGLTATFATIVSLVVSFTLAPMLAARLLTKANTSVDEPTTGGRGGGIAKALRAFGRWFDGQLEQLKTAYRGALGWCLHYRWTTMLIVFGLLIGAFLLVFGGLIGSEFITMMDQGEFLVSIEMPTGARLAETDEATRRIEAVLTDPAVLPELISTYVSVGRTIQGQVGGASQAVNIAQVSVRIVDKTQREESTAEIIERLRPVLASAAVPGAKIKLMEEGAGGGGEAPIQLDLVSDDLEQLRAFAAEVLAVMADPELTPGAIDVDSNYRLGQPEIRVLPDRDKCRDCEVDTAFLSDVIHTAFEGKIVSEYRAGAFDYDIRVRSDEASRETVEDVRLLTIMNRQGHLIPLPQVADIEVTTGPSQLFRKDRQSLITLSSDVSGKSMGEVVASIEQNCQALLRKYPTVTYSFGGDVEHMQESFGRLFVALAMAIFLTYMLLAALLESFIQPVIIMFSLPLSLIGVFFALFLMGGTFSIFSIMSIIMLVGLVINNAIVVLDYVNTLRRNGKNRTEAILEAGSTRLRPILMANLTTVVALIPLAAGMGWGGEMRAPMAMVQIGGLFAGGGLGLIIVPVLYSMVDDWLGWLAHVFLGRKA